MKRVSIFMSCAVVFGMGYLTGRVDSGSARIAQAQQTTVEDISSDTLVFYYKFRKGCADLGDSLQAEGLNVRATEDINYFALSVGGVDALRDLEEGRGVDPETFAAIYGDRASPEVSQHLDEDELGRIRYKGTVVRMYSRERLKELFQLRDQIAIRASRSQ